MADKKPTPKDVDAYLDTAPARAVAALRALRSAIQAAAPNAEEVISYGLPTYRLKGVLVSFSATPNHCAFYVMSKGPIAARKAELAGYDLAPTAIRFQPESPLPEALVAAIVQDRIAENSAKR